MGLFSAIKKIGSKALGTAVSTFVPGGGAIVAGVSAGARALKGRGGKVAVSTPIGIKVGSPKDLSNLIPGANSGALGFPGAQGGSLLDRPSGALGLTAGQQFAAGAQLFGPTGTAFGAAANLLNLFPTGSGGAQPPAAMPGAPPMVSGFVPGFGWIPPGRAFKPMTRMTNKAPAGTVLITRKDPATRQEITIAVDKDYARKNFGYKSPAKPLISVKQSQALRRSATAQAKLKKEAQKFYRVTNK